MRPAILRVAAFAFFGCFVLAAVPLSGAQDEIASGATDPAGDVYPTAWAASLPGVVEHAEFLDLSRFEVTHESYDDFVIELELGDLPDDWLLEPAPPGGLANPPISLPAGQKIPSVPIDYFDNRVQHRIFFTIDGVDYVANASLAELNLHNAQEFPKVNTTTYYLKLVDALQLKLDELRADVLSDGNLSGVLRLSQRQVALDAIDEARDAVDLAEATFNSMMDCSAVEAADGLCAMPSGTEQTTQPVRDHFRYADENLSEAYDAVEDLDISKQLNTSFAASMELVDTNLIKLPAVIVDGSGSEAEPAAPAAPASPTAVLFHKFELYRVDEGEAGPVLVALDAPGGLVDLKSNTVRMTFAKDDVGAKKGLKLGEFRAEASFKGTRVDYAPDATVGNPGPTEIVFGVVGQQVVAPVYGKEYEFVVEAPAPGPSGPVVRIHLTPVGPSAVEIKPGGTATYYVTLKNVGSAALGGYFSLSPDGEGWTSQVSEPIWSLSAGSSGVFTVIVAAASGADLEKITTLTATVDGAESTSVDLRTTMQPQSADVDAPGSKEKSAKKGGLPGFEAVGLLAALAALVVLVRRRA